MDFVADENRLTTPLIKQNGKFEKATWQQAIKLIAERLTGIKTEFGPDAIAGLSSAKCTNEDNYVFQKFIRAAGCATHQRLPGLQGRSAVVL